MKTYEYIILEGYTATELSERVNEHALQSWQLHGSLCMVFHNGEHRYAQAMTRPIEHPGAWS